MSAIQTVLFDYGIMPVNDAINMQVLTQSIRADLGTAQNSLINAGTKLIQAKETLPHGQWQNWLAVEFDMSDRTAQNMMNVAREFSGKTEIISLFKPTALYALAAPSLEPEIREAIIAKVEAGESVDVKAEIKEWKDKYWEAQEFKNAQHKQINQQAEKIRGLENSLDQKATEIAQAKISEIESGLDEKFQQAVEREVSANSKKVEDLQFTIIQQRDRLKALESPAEIQKLNSQIAEQEQRLAGMKIKINAEKADQDLDAIARTAIEYIAQLKVPFAETVIEIKTFPDFKPSALTINALFESANELTALADRFRELAYIENEEQEWIEEGTNPHCKECNKVLKNWEVDELTDICEVCYDNSMEAGHEKMAA